MIGKKELERFNDLEERILRLNSKKDGISYAKDLTMESLIKYQVLSEKYGADRVDLIFEKMDINKESLLDQDTYILVDKYLKENK